MEFGINSQLKTFFSPINTTILYLINRKPIIRDESASEKENRVRRALQILFDRTSRLINDFAPIPGETAIRIPEPTAVVPGDGVLFGRRSGQVLGQEEATQRGGGQGLCRRDCIGARAFA